MHYCVHQHYPTSPIIKVYVAPSVPWYENWRGLDITTGDTALDAFLNRYNIALVAFADADYLPYSLRDWASLRLPWAINPNAFADSLGAYSGLWTWRHSDTFGDGDEIKYWTDSAQHLRFIAGRGDCPAGCTEAKIWYYTISDGCTVQLDTVIDEIYRDRYRPNCNLAPVLVRSQPGTPKGLQLFPNPVHQTLHLRGASITLQQYAVYDLAGKLLLTGTYNGQDIDVSKLNSGFYFLRLISSEPGLQTVLRFVKQ
jgi:hypothetical protein